RPAVRRHILDQQHPLARLENTFRLGGRAESHRLLPHDHQRQVQPVGDHRRERHARDLAARDNIDRLVADVGHDAPDRQLDDRVPRERKRDQPLAVDEDGARPAGREEERLVGAEQHRARIEQDLRGQLGEIVARGVGGGNHGSDSVTVRRPLISTSAPRKKSSKAMASAGLWEPCSFRMKIITVGTPSLAKIAASWPAPEGSRSCGISSRSQTASKWATRRSSITAGAVGTAGPKSKATPRERPIASPSSCTSSSKPARTSGDWLRYSRLKRTSPGTRLIACSAGLVPRIPRVTTRSWPCCSNVSQWRSSRITNSDTANTASWRSQRGTAPECAASPRHTARG